MCKIRNCIFVLLSLFSLVGTVSAATWLWCTDFVANDYNIGGYGDAKTWWDDTRFTSTGYTKSSTPVVGAIVVFNGWSSNSYGHVAIVRQIVSSSEIKVDHSNWHWDGNPLYGVGIKQASGSWSSVKVKFNPGDSSYSSSTYPVRGFLIPPSSSYSVIGMNSPYFKQKCIDQYPWDSRCVTADIDPWLECHDTNGTRRPLCDYGVGGGDITSTYPDFIVSQNWLQDGAGNAKSVFRPGESISMKGKIKNTGVGNPSTAITVKFYLSNGQNPDSNKQTVGTDTIQAYNLTAGSTHTETESMNVPTVPGTYNIQVCADTGGVVTEEHESNNCLAMVFQVDDYSWLIPIIQLLLND